MIVSTVSDTNAAIVCTEWNKVCLLILTQILTHNCNDRENQKRCDDDDDVEEEMRLKRRKITSIYDLAVPFDIAAKALSIFFFPHETSYHLDTLSVTF